MKIIKSFLNFWALIFGKKMRTVNKSYSTGDSIHWSKRDMQYIAETAQRMNDIINESLQIAKSTKNSETKASRVRVARQKLNELIDYCNKFTFIKIDKLHEVDTNIREFEAEIINEGHSDYIIKLQNDKTYHNNQELIKGMVFYATLQVRTPLSVLIHHGEGFHGPPSKVPRYGTEADGYWSYDLTPWRELGIDIDEMPESESASDVGPVKANEYLPFLIEFRKIVESQESVDKKIVEIKRLGRNNRLFKHFIRKLNAFYKYKSDFPNSFFYNQFTGIPGIGQKSAKSLFEAGIKTFDDLNNADDKIILGIPGIGPAALKKIKSFDK
jgi:hypothetical protein